MKKLISQTRSNLGWLPLGLERGARTAIRWAKEPDDKQKSRRRAAVIFGAPAGFVFAAMEHPTLAITGSFTLLIGVGAWFGYTERNEMQIEEIETSAPYEVDGVPMTGREVFQRFLELHAGEDLTTLAGHMGEGIDPAELGRQMQMWGVETPPLRIPSPTQEGRPEKPKLTVVTSEDEEETAGERGQTVFVKPCLVDHANAVTSRHDDEAEDDREGAAGAAGPGGLADESAAAGEERERPGYVHLGDRRSSVRSA